MQIALCAGDFRDAGEIDTGVAIDVRERSEGDFRSLGSILDGSIDVDAGDIKVGLLYGANRRTMEERLGVMERCNGTFWQIEGTSASHITYFHMIGVSQRCPPVEPNWGVDRGPTGFFAFRIEFGLQQL